nr:hypothetical protein [Tanacetum cinerariifolium]
MDKTNVNQSIYHIESRIKRTISRIRIKSQKGSEVGKGVKEKQVLMADKSGEAYGIHSSPSVNEENMNDVGTMLRPTPVDNTHEDVENIPVWVKLHRVPVMVFSEDGLSVIATKIGTPLMFDSYTSDMCLQSWGMSSYARAMIELQADMELKDTIVVAMLKLTGEGFYTCTIRVEYEWKHPRCTCCKVFHHIQEECPKNSGLVKQTYRPVSTKPATNTGRNKKNDVEPIKKVSNSNLFDVLNSVENDVDLIDHDIEDEVASVDNNIARSIASEKVGYGTNSLLEQLKDTYENDDCNYDSYDDDMYEGQENS